MAANEEKACNYKRQHSDTICQNEKTKNTRHKKLSQYVKMRRRRIHDTKIVTTCQNEKFRVEEKNEQGRKRRRRRRKKGGVSTLLTQITVQKKMSSEVTKMNNAHAVSKDKIL